MVSVFQSKAEGLRPKTVDDVSSILSPGVKVGKDRCPRSKTSRERENSFLLSFLFNSGPQWAEAHSYGEGRAA